MPAQPHTHVVVRLLVAVVATILLTVMVRGSNAHIESTMQEVSAAEMIPANHYVSAQGTSLYLHDQRYQFTGINAFNLGTYPGVNAGCGSFVSDVDAFFSNLRPNAAVRMWAFQGTIATNTTTKKLDWTGLDRVVNAAAKNGKKLILVLGDQSGHCDDGHWKDKAWYQGAYKQAVNDYGNGLTPLPYLEYVKAIVTRYKDSPAIAMWEPINEPAASDCTSGKGYECYANQVCADETAAATALRSFFDTVGGSIKAIDTNHLVSSGTIGDGQCGAVWEDYQYIHQSPGIDVASYHDYQRDDQPMPGDEWNGLQKRLNQMNLIGKPLIVGEVGMLASDMVSGCMSYTARRDKMKAKMDAQFAAGVAGLMPWSLTLGAAQGCNYDVIAGDPLLSLLNGYPVSMSSLTPSLSITPFPSPTPTSYDTQPPSIPTNLRTTNVSATQVGLAWDASTDNVGVARYDIFRDYAYVTSTTGTSYTNTNLLPGKGYMYYVKAKDTVGNYSAASAKLTVTTAYVGPSPTATPTSTPTPIPVADTQPPAAPTNLIATSISTNQIALKWNAATDNVGVVRYELYRDYAYLTATTGTSFTNILLSPGRTYKYYLKARDAAGNSSVASSILTVTTAYIGGSPTPTLTPTITPTRAPDTQPPAAPTNLTATSPSSTQVTLNWTAATDNVGVVRYEVYRDYAYVTAVTGTTYTNSNLQPGKTYLYYLKSRDAAGNSSGSSMKVTVTTLPN